MSNTVAIEFLLHLPVQSLLRFRAVSKFWRDVIDSPSFRKLHTHTHTHTHNNDNDDEEEGKTVYLRFTFHRDCKLSIKLLDNGKSLKPYNGFNDYHDFPNNRLMKSVAAVKGLICLRRSDFALPLAICNPFLGQFKILPKSQTQTETSTCKIESRGVGICVDGEEDYKVVEILSCRRHRRLHAHLYSRRADSWRELGGDGGVLGQDLVIGKQIKTSCKNGRFAHWRGRRRVGAIWEEIILSFDVESEDFRAITMSNFGKSEEFRYVTLWRYASMLVLEKRRIEILAKDDRAFLLFVSPCKRGKVVRVHESRFEGSELIWEHVMDLGKPSLGMPLGGSDCVVFEDLFAKNELVSYDHRARRFVGRWEVPASSTIVEYRGSLISP